MAQRETLVMRGGLQRITQVGGYTETTPNHFVIPLWHIEISLHIMSCASENPGVGVRNSQFEMGEKALLDARVSVQ